LILIAVTGFVFLNLKEKSINSQEKFLNDQDILQAQETLLTFFFLLQEKKYEEAKNFLGNFEFWQTLREWNPDIDPQNYTQLIQAGCEENGLVCLKIKKIIQAKQIDAKKFNFTVQFENTDGSLFETNACCSKVIDNPTQTDFDYIVQKQFYDFKIITAPLLLP